MPVVEIVTVGSIDLEVGLEEWWYNEDTLIEVTVDPFEYEGDILLESFAVELPVVELILKNTEVGKPEYEDPIIISLVAEALEGIAE